MTTSDATLTTRSEQLWREATQLIPGGVNSPVRAFRAVGGSPIFFERAQGAYLYDVDGKRYVDYIGAWGPMILGHAHPAVREALHAAVDGGTVYGAPTAAEVEIARTITAIMPAIEQVRLVNSGTEATMSALRLARAFTGRERIVKFSGCYHGHADMLLVQAGSGVATLGLPDSPGVPASVAAATLSVTFNDVQSVKAAFAAYGDSIAAVIVEPVVGNSGTIAPADGFLSFLREITRDQGALLIFDEVMTGFRVALGGAQARYGVAPDLTCLGKIVGGGVPVGAYGGSQAIMQHVAPAGPMYQAGTLSGNCLATAAGLTTLRELQKPGVYERLETLGARLEAGLRKAATEACATVWINRVGAMLTIFFTEGPVTDWPSASQSNRADFGRFFHGMLRRGFYLPPAQFEAWFVSLAHTEADIDATCLAAREVFEEMKASE